MNYWEIIKVIYKPDSPRQTEFQSVVQTGPRGHAGDGAESQSEPTQPSGLENNFHLVHTFYCELNYGSFLDNNSQQDLHVKKISGARPL
ncbi:unnamed protein product [Thelazia callipaeda]|uniref:Uncharacterized protein n=1 Tax=Thelazia callipaeda TaxID=103827 RepID=A0A0N5D6N3_THECL|nr:unnamed protein product [Thelazia callipaeda]